MNAIINTVMTCCEAFKDTDGKFYLKLTYEYEDPKGTHEVIFPKVSLPLCHNIIPAVNMENPRLFYNDHICDLNGRSYINCKDEMKLFKKHVVGVDGEHYYIDRIIKPAVRKMTVEEIEKQLGYKVEIVSNEEKKG